MYRVLFLVVPPLCALGQVRTVTLREAVDLALKQNPDIVLARLEERRTEAAIRIARAPFVPRAGVGSGLAYSSGMPLSVGQSPPSLFLAQAVSTIFDRPLSYRIAAVRESRRTAGFETAARQEEVAYRTADLYITAEAAAKALGAAAGEVNALETALNTVRAQVTEGRELPITARRAELALERARYRARALQTSLIQAENALATVLGLEAVRVAPGERPIPAVPESVEAAVESGVKTNREIRALESRLLAKGYEVRAAKAAWLPRADLIAEYALVSKFNNYDEFYRKFERNNAQVGLAFQFPIWPGTGANAQADQAETEAAQVRVQLRNARRRVEENVRSAYSQMEQAEAAQRLARLDLEVAREQVAVLQAQAEEGRAPVRELEEARAIQIDRSIELLNAAVAAERARLALLREAGTLSAALQ